MGVLDSMTVFETVGPGSIPGRVIQGSPTRRDAESEAEARAYEERAKVAEVLEGHPALLRLVELETLRDLAKNANARLYLNESLKEEVRSVKTVACEPISHFTVHSSDFSLVLGVCRIARDFAEVVDQVRFLARTLATYRLWSAAWNERRLRWSRI